MEEAGDEALQGAVGDAGHASGTDLEHVAKVKVGGGAAGKGGVIPDGVDEDIVDGGEGPVAVAGDEDAAGVRAPESGGGQAGERLQVEGTDEVQQTEPQIARILAALPRRGGDHLVLLLVALGRGGRGFAAWGGAVLWYITRWAG